MWEYSWYRQPQQMVWSFQGRVREGSDVNRPAPNRDRSRPVKGHVDRLDHLRVGLPLRVLQSLSTHGWWRLLQNPWRKGRCGVVALVSRSFLSIPARLSFFLKHS